MYETIFSAITASVIANGIILYFLKSWFTARLKSSIEAEYKIQHELFTRELDKKDKIELVSEVLAEFLRTQQGDGMTKEERTNLNKLSFKCSLWLPSELSKELSFVLQKKTGAKSPFEILLMAREALIHDSSLSAKHVTWWNYDKEKKEDKVEIVT